MMLALEWLKSSDNLMSASSPCPWEDASSKIFLPRVLRSEWVEKCSAIEVFHRLIWRGLLLDVS